MAIADRINEMYTHVGDVYDTITNVDLPTNKNIQNIPQTIKDSYLEIMNNGIDTIWNNWEKVTGEGTSLTLNNTYQAPMKNELKGNTSQTGTPTPTSPIPVNVVSGDNTITISNQGGTDSNTYNIDLPSGMELCKIGNYQDYFYKDSGKWYLHKEIGKVVLNGSESWQTISSGNLYYITGTGIKQQTGITQEIPMLSNRFIVYSYQALYDALVDYGISSHTTDRLCIRNKDITSVANLKTWLGNNNTIVYFPLSTPTNELVEYQPLIDQLNELEKAISYENQTNISQVNNDLPFIISASALKKG